MVGCLLLHYLDVLINYCVVENFRLLHHYTYITMHVVLRQHFIEILIKVIFLRKKWFLLVVSVSPIINYLDIVRTLIKAEHLSGGRHHKIKINKSYVKCIN